MVRIAGGVAGVFMRVMVRNVMSGHELTLAGYLYGGYFAKLPFDVGGKRPSNPKDTLDPIGDVVTFEMPKAEDFDFFVGSDNGQWVRLVHDAVGVVKKVETSFLQFTGLDTFPGSLVFEFKTGWTLATLNLSVVTGILHVEGPIPSDYVDSHRMVTVPKNSVNNFYDGVLVSFPTGKAGYMI